MRRAIKFLINKSEITAGTRGASLGPEAMMVAARKQGSDFFAQYDKVYLEDVNYYLDHEIKYPLAKRIGGLLQVFENVTAAIDSTVKEGKFPFLLSGDHGSAGGTIAGIKAAFPDKRLGVIWIDAHADIHTPYTTPSGNMHGMPLATALAIDNLEEQVNDPIPEVAGYWEKLKNVGIPGAKIQATDLIYVAVRDTEPQEDAVLSRFNICNHSVAAVRAEGAEAIAQKCLSQLKDCDVLYISFDVDSMDPDHSSKGTGTPVGNGLMPEEAEVLLQLLAADPRTVCMEFVEINPCLDDRMNRMAEIAFDLLEKTVKHL
jgi:arginase